MYLTLNLLINKLLKYVAKFCIDVAWNKIAKPFYIFTFFVYIYMYIVELN